MKMPGFNAEDSLYETGEYYGIATTGYPRVARSLIPQGDCCPGIYWKCCKYRLGPEVKFDCMEQKDCWNKPGGVLVSDHYCCKPIKGGE